LFIEHRRKDTVEAKTTLTEKIASVLQAEFKNCATVIAGNGNILITISTQDFKERLGIMYREASELVEQHFPDRNEDIRLFFADRNGLQQATFRLWHPVAA
jgi:hypothetical protein